MLIFKLTTETKKIRESQTTRSGFFVFEPYKLLIVNLQTAFLFVKYKFLNLGQDQIFKFFSGVQKQKTQKCNNIKYKPTKIFTC